jgi:hypothetical protein
LAYQEEITGLPRGLEVTLNGVRFDGCIEADGTMLEAKGPGFENKMDGPDDWQDWFTGDEQLEAQMERQSDAVEGTGRKVEWHFAEEPVADFFRAYAEIQTDQHCRDLYTTEIAMTGEVNHVEAYWRPRPESTRDCAVRLARMLEGLVKAHSAFSHWNKQAYSRAAANKPAWHMPPHIDELTTVFEKGRQYKDRPRVLWPEMGYSVSAWNGIERPHGATLRIRSGGFTSSRFFPNTVDLKVNRAGPDNTDLISSAVLKPALLSVATAWGGPTMRSLSRGHIGRGCSGTADILRSGAAG